MQLSPRFPPHHRRDPRFRREADVYRQLAQCGRPGFALYEVRPLPHTPDLDFAIWLLGRARIGLQVKGGHYQVENAVWRLHTQGRVQRVAASPLTQTFDSAIALRDAVKIRLGRSVHIIAVILFPDMRPDPDIEAWARARGVMVLWGCLNLVERLLRLAEEVGVHEPPTAQDIREEVAAVTQGLVAPDLSEPPAPRTPLQSRRQPARLSLSVDRLGILNVYIRRRDAPSAPGPRPTGANRPEHI